MDFLKSMAIAASGLRAQAGRMRVISENIANADSIAQTPGGILSPAHPDLPVRARPFAQRAGRVARRGAQRRDRFRTKFEPGNPARTRRQRQISNVNSLIEMTDMRDASVLRGERQRHRRDPRDDSTHPRHSARLIRRASMATPGIAAGAYARMAQITDPAGGLNKVIGGGADQARASATCSRIRSRRCARPGDIGRPGDRDGHRRQDQHRRRGDGVAETETTINTLVSVRDKVVAAYEQIMQMPI